MDTYSDHGAGGEDKISDIDSKKESLRTVNEELSKDGGIAYYFDARFLIYIQP